MFGIIVRDTWCNGRTAAVIVFCPHVYIYIESLNLQGREELQADSTAVQQTVICNLIPTQNLENLLEPVHFPV